METPTVYISKCADKINFHKQQTINCRSWNNAVNLLTVVLASTESFLMILFVVLQVNTFTVALCSGIFAMAIIISSKIRENYQFLALSFMHENIVNELTVLHYEFVEIQTDYDNDVFDRSTYNKCVVKFANVLIRSHLQEVSSCRSICFCQSKPNLELL